MKKICFISSTRADYGLLKWSMKAVAESRDFELQIIALGMHLSPLFGETYKEIEKDQFKVNEKVFLGNMEDSPTSVASQIAKALEGVSAALVKLRPDAIVLLGDRYEILGAAQAAFFLSIPIIHLHGGEKTEGAFDDSIRHCITKLSTYHVTSTEPYRQRVIQLGEQPKEVFNLGAPGLENFLKLQLVSHDDLLKDLNMTYFEKNILVTFHPVTGANDNISEVLEALSKFPDVGQFISLPNSDPGYSHIVAEMKEYAQKNKNVFLFSSLGQLRYSSLLKIVDLVVGNSSSGILESPFVGTRSLNIGERQKGRLAADIVYNVECRKEKIATKIKELLEQKYEKKQSLLYGDGNFSTPFLELLKKLSLEAHSKKFYDLESDNG